jgi:hypothetical protein
LVPGVWRQGVIADFLPASTGLLVVDRDQYWLVDPGRGAKTELTPK